MFGNLGGWHWVVILLIVLLLFGAPKLPALARSIGQSMRIFKNEVKSQDPVVPAATDAAPAAATTDADNPAGTGDTAAKK